MINWVRSTIKSCSIAEWTFLVSERIKSVPIIYFELQGNLIFTPLSFVIDSGIDHTKSSTITLTMAENPQHIAVLEGATQIVTDQSNIQKYLQKLIIVNPAMSNLLQTKQHYLSSYLSESIFCFNPTKLQSWDIENNEFNEIEVHIL